MSEQFLLFGLLLAVGVFLLYSNQVQVQAEGKTLLEAISEMPTLSEAKAIISQDKLLLQLMMTLSLTAFIPTNEALTKYEGPRDRLFYYHLANISYKAQDLPEDLNTLLTGNPRLYITRTPNDKPSISGWEDYDYYVNNAKITSANHIAMSEDGHKQIFHVVDHVIAPTIPKPETDGLVPTAYMNPDAKKLLEKPDLYGLVNEFSTTPFEKRVRELDLLDTFAMDGKNTFFVPLVQLTHKKDLIDKVVIRCHIVPKEVLFTRPAEGRSNKSMALAFIDHLRVLIDIQKVVVDEPDGEIMYYVTGNTPNEYTSHLRGIYLARIVKANIPQEFHYAKEEKTFSTSR
ncbi:fasciclin-1-like isoform X2 [Palaemon carinicauda]|uniref:fasciclin-1-like isoform X2 n=1 Tax=Palaemon carinicauda TaxID=392227 RepID=UPI0035B5ADE5